MEIKTTNPSVAEGLIQIFNKATIAFFAFLVQQILWGVLQVFWHTFVQQGARLGILWQPAVAFHNMLWESMVLLVVFNKLFEHAAQHCWDSIKPLDGCADIAEAFLIA